MKALNIFGQAVFFSALTVFLIYGIILAYPV